MLSIFCTLHLKNWAFHLKWRWKNILGILVLMRQRQRKRCLFLLSMLYLHNFSPHSILLTYFHTTLLLITTLSLPHTACICPSLSISSLHILVIPTITLPILLILFSSLYLTPTLPLYCFHHCTCTSPTCSHHHTCMPLACSNHHAYKSPTCSHHNACMSTTCFHYHNVTNILLTAVPQHPCILPGWTFPPDNNLHP